RRMDCLFSCCHFSRECSIAVKMGRLAAAFKVVPIRKVGKDSDTLEPAGPLIFDSVFLSKLEQLYLLSRKLFRGQHHAERRSRQAGSSLEFADYRNYAFGDDLRNIDWNIYG